MALFNQALGAKGATEKDALKAVLPELTQLQKDQAMGAKLTPEEMDLLAKAQAEGLLPMKDIQTQQLETLRGIEKNTGGKATGTPNAGTGGGARGYGPGYAEGFYSPSMPTGPLPGGGSPMVVHPGERVSVTPKNSGGWSQGGSRMDIHLAPQLNVGTLVGDPQAVVGMITDALQSAHPELTAAVQAATWHG